MQSIIQFNFREKQYSASYAICQREQPIYVFVFFNDAELVREFGEELCIHTNGNDLLVTDVYPEKRYELSRVIFENLKQTETFFSSHS